MRLIVYNCFTLTYLNNIIHTSSEIIVEIPDVCMIVLTSDTMNTDYKSRIKMGGSHISNLTFLLYY